MSAADFQSALNPAASESAHIAHLWWTFFWVTLVIFALVAIFLFIAILRNIRRGSDDPQLAIPEPAEATESRATTVVSALVVITVLILFALLIGDFFTGNAIYAT